MPMPPADSPDRSPAQPAPLVHQRLEVEGGVFRSTLAHICQALAALPPGALLEVRTNDP